MKLKDLLNVVPVSELELYDITTGENQQDSKAHISGKRVMTYKKTCEKLLECTVTYIQLKEGRAYITVYPYLE